MTTDPYKVLGVTPEASNDDIKKAYRTLSRRYHPDANINNPNKAQAEEKFKEIQVAYDTITKDRENGYYSGYGPFGAGDSTYQGYEESPRLRAAANYINAQSYREAMTVLESIQERNATWYYYSAIANQGLGNNVSALSAARQAAAMEPDNVQYQILLKRMEGGGVWYENMGEGFGRAGGVGKICTTLCWLSFLCNCCFARPY